MSLRASPDLIAKAEGQPLEIRGSVTDARCRPLSGATLELWQTNADGEYGPGHGTSEMRCCYVQGAVRTDAAGRYQVETIMPGHYSGEAPPPPAHIHVWVSHPSAQTLSTELDFAGDPYLPADAKAVLHLDHVAGRLHGTFDFVLTDR
jgi:protocatechuate 3,4-dioxygenase beta subunit